MARNTIMIKVDAGTSKSLFPDRDDTHKENSYNINYADKCIHELIQLLCIHEMLSPYN